MRDYPLADNELDIPYDQALDTDHSSRATHFLLNTRQAVVWKRWNALAGRRGFFDTSPRASTRPTCWVVKDKTKQISLSHNSETHHYAPARFAARLWLDETSVLRLLSDRRYRVHAVCHNNRCVNPRHIVVESPKEFNERRACRRANRCSRHKFTLKPGGFYRRRCLVP